MPLDVYFFKPCLINKNATALKTITHANEISIPLFTIFGSKDQSLISFDGK